MKRLRLWLVGLCAWFFFLFNLERLGVYFDLASFIYVMSFAVAVLIILLPPLQRISPIWLLAASLLPYFILKIQLGYPLDSDVLPIVITEACAIGVTIFLAGHLGRRLESIRETLAGLTIGNLGGEAEPFATGQARIYSEIRRARLYERPATLLAISASKESTELSINHFMREAQRGIIKQYIAARISELLVEELHDCDIVAQRNNHFITLLPETTPESVHSVIERIREKAAKELNLHLNIGLAAFPDEAVTFESLLSIAEAQMVESNNRSAESKLQEITLEIKVLPSPSSYSKETTVLTAR